MRDSIINVKVIAKDMASSVFKAIKGAASNLTAPFKAAGNAVKGFANFLISIPGLLAAAGITKFFSDAVGAAQEFERAMVTLEIIAPRFGVSVDEAKRAAEELGRELRIGPAAAAESLQNLFKSGLNLDQSAELLRRFTNEAITGKSPTISLSQAVQNLSFAYTTSNSALGNLSGISENFSDIINKGRESLIKQGMAADKVTDDMAKFQGMMELTNLTMGSSEKFAGTLIDTQAEVSLRFEEMQRSVGQRLAPILNEFLKLVLRIGDSLQPVGEAIGNLITPAFEMFGLIIGQVVEGVRGFALAFKDSFESNQGGLMPVIERFRATASAVFSRVQAIFQSLGRIISDVVTALRPVIDALITGFIAVANVVLNQLLPVVIDVAGSIMQVLEPAIKVIANVLGVVLPPIIQTFVALFQGIAAVIKFAWENVIRPVFNLLSGVFGTAMVLIQAAWENIGRPALNAIAIFINSVVIPVISPIANAFSQAFNGVRNVVEGVFNFLKFNIIYPFLDIIDRAHRDVNSLLNRSQEVDSANQRIQQRAAERRSAEQNAAIASGQAAGPVRRASGGQVMGGQPYIVGERGAEMFVPSQRGEIVPNHRMGGQPINITVNNMGGELDTTALAARLNFLIQGA